MCGCVGRSVGAVTACVVSVGTGSTRLGLPATAVSSRLVRCFVNDWGLCLWLGTTTYVGTLWLAQRLFSEVLSEWFFASPLS